MLSEICIYKVYLCHKKSPRFRIPMLSDYQVSTFCAIKRSTFTRHKDTFFTQLKNPHFIFLRETIKKCPKKLFFRISTLSI